MTSTENRRLESLRVPGQLSTIDEIESAARSQGSHWFDRDTMRFFASRVSDHIYPYPGGAVFVSSERGPRFDSPRRYTVRLCTVAGEIDTIGEFQAYASRNGAHSAARKAALERGAK